MVDRIGNSSNSLARAAIEAALKRQSDAVSSMKLGVDGTSSAKPSAFSQALSDGLKAVDSEVRRVDDLPKDLAAGRIQDLSEIAAQLKESDLSLRFALEVRNKFIDAYREVMRMSV
ncbi:MAG: flagellar hook-basal body complex protein FliE [Planctomycetes bacterium]|nr:flagellar hook-basal body complex protein FliE [Planctomycetota bacterium]